jgi:ketosteroid isomerase-like protein
MSQENVEIVRGMYRPGDPTGFFDLLDEDVEVDVSRRPLVPDHPALIRGKQAAIEFYSHYWGTWADYSLEPDEILDAGTDDVVVVQHERGKGKGSGVPFESRWALIYTLTGGKIGRITHYGSEQSALEAAGLSE